MEGLSLSEWIRNLEIHGFTLNEVISIPSSGNIRNS
jgi:hypothetical protein